MNVGDQLLPSVQTPPSPGTNRCADGAPVDATGKLDGPVALIVAQFPPAFGGVERHVERLATGLLQRGIAAEVITTDPSGRLPPVECQQGVVIRRFPTVRGLGPFFISPHLILWLARNARRFALLHAHSYHTPLAAQAALVSARTGVPLVVTPHYHGTGHSPLRLLMHVPYRPFGAWMLRKARYVICMTEAEQNHLRRDFGPDLLIDIVPSGVDVEEFRRAPARDKEPGRKLILAGGRLERYKGTLVVIEALAHLPPAYRAVIMGDGPDRDTLARHVVALGLQERVRFLGRVPRDELLSWYRTADTFVNLSSHEALGLTLMEALAAGASIVASDILAHREVAAHAPAARVTFLPAAASPDEVASAIKLATELGRVECVENLSLPTWEGMIDGTVRCYLAATGS